MNRRQGMFALASASTVRVSIATTPFRHSRYVIDTFGRYHDISSPMFKDADLSDPRCTLRKSEAYARIDEILFGVGFWIVERYSLDSTCEIWRHRDGGAA